MNRRQFHALLGSTALMLAYSLTVTGLSFFIVPVTKELGCDRASFSFHFTIMTCTTVLTSFVLGRIIRVFGLRCLLVWGGLLGTACFVAFAFCSDLSSFYAIAAIMGLLSTACSSIAAAIIVTRWFSEKNGLYMGIVTAGTGFGAGILSLALPVFLTAYGWRAGYLLLACLWAGLMFMAVVLAGESPGEIKMATPDNAEASVGVSFMEERSDFMRVTRSPGFYVFIFGIFILFLGTTFAQHMPAYFKDVGASDVRAGFIVSVFGFSFMLFKIAEGYLFDKMGAVKLLFSASATYALGFWILLGEGVLSYYTGVVFLSTGIALVAVMPPLMTARLYGNHLFPALWGIVSLGNYFGKAVGIPAWGMVYDRFGSYKTGIMLFPFFIGGACLILFLVFRMNKNH